MVLQETRKQKFDHFKKQALLVFTTALRAPLMLMMSCGFANDVGGERRQVHDHGGKKMLDLVTVDVPYNETIHGPLEEFVEEGEQVPGVPNSLDGRAPIHRHIKPGSVGYGGTTGPYEYSYEEIK